MLPKSQEQPFVHRQSHVVPQNQDAISGLSYLIKEPDRLFNPASVMTDLTCVLFNENDA
jgi:hypothetical protein